SGSALAANVCKKITGRLTSAIAKQEDVSVQLEALDIMADMLSRQGGLLVNFHPSILTCLLPQLTSPRLAVRKRTIIALGHLVMSCGNMVFVDLIEHLLTELSKNDSMSTTRTYIQCIAAISRQAGHRIGKKIYKLSFTLKFFSESNYLDFFFLFPGEYLEKIIPLVVKFCNVDDDELREYCIQAFESFVRRCPKEVYPHVSTIINICLKYLTYDPNYNYDDEDEDENAMDADGGDDDDQG
ncbi:CAND1 protein, partial [Regulus satrapa]|nr:CAND1 protein [Regulus satrapa]